MLSVLLLLAFKKATPVTFPAALKAGPPLLPGLMAASICMASSVLKADADTISIRLTIPSVMQMVVPPVG